MNYKIGFFFNLLKENERLGTEESWTVLEKYEIKGYKSSTKLDIIR